MKIIFNQVTWYSRLLAIFLFLLIAALSFCFGRWFEKTKVGENNLINQLEKKYNYQSLNIDTNMVPSPSPQPPANPNPRQTSPSPSATPANIQNQNNNTNRSCNKPTIVLSTLAVSRQEADSFFASYGLSLYEDQSSTQKRLLVNIGTGSDSYWINKISNDGIGVASYDNFGCDFR